MDTFYCEQRRSLLLLEYTHGHRYTFSEIPHFRKIPPTGDIHAGLRLRSEQSGEVPAI
jgi:hypothetical protein